MAGQISNAGEFTALSTLFPTTGTTYAMLLAPTNGAWVIDDTTTLATAVTYEVTDTAYARKPIAWTAPALNGVTGSIVKNSVDINWTAWALDQPITKKIAMMAIVDAVSGSTGKVLAYFILASGSELAPTATQPVKILANQLTISLN